MDKQADDDAPAGAPGPHLFWTSWYEPVHEWHHRDGPENDPEYLTPDWPSDITVLGEWVSGYRLSDDAQTVCAYVEAPDRAAVKHALEAEKREIRFISWRPPGTPIAFR
jgi:hypothetical protein